jgi:hypothetical protein
MLNMENIIFGFVLFVVYFCFASYFCFVSYFLYTPSSTNAESVEPIEKLIQRMFQEIDSVGENLEDEVLKPLQEQTLVSAVDLEQLTPHARRQICKALKIKQSVDRKKVSVKRLKAQIEQRLKEEPSNIFVVREIL